MRPVERVPYAVAWACAALLLGQRSAAQTAPGDERPEIVVTAQRRPERAEDVPISLTAITGEDLERMQATDMAGLGKVVPSLVMSRTSVFTQPFLRGVGKRSNLGVENGVATYVDGVYLASSISAMLDLRGIDRIEVLNGPQGTLFGRNATGGVIQIITRDPTSDASGEFMLHAGTDEHIRGDMYLTGGNDRLAGNVALSLSHTGGYGTNLYTGRNDQGEIDHSFVGRTKWIWRPESRAEADTGRRLSGSRPGLAAPARQGISADWGTARTGLPRRQSRHAEPLPLPLRWYLASGRCRDREHEADEP